MVAELLHGEMVVFGLRIPGLLEVLPRLCLSWVHTIMESHLVVLGVLLVSPVFDVFMQFDQVLVHLDRLGCCNRLVRRRASADIVVGVI